MDKIIRKLCAENEVTPYVVAKETDIPYTTLLDWYNGRTTPRADAIPILAKYFSVSIEEFYEVGDD